MNTTTTQAPNIAGTGAIPIMRGVEYRCGDGPCQIGNAMGGDGDDGACHASSGLW